MAGSRLDFSTGAIINPFSQTQSALESISNTIGSISKQYLDKQQHEERMAESKAAREESNNRFAQEMALNDKKWEASNILAQAQEKRELAAFNQKQQDIKDTKESENSVRALLADGGMSAVKRLQDRLATEASDKAAKGLYDMVGKNIDASYAGGAIGEAEYKGQKSAWEADKADFLKRTSNWNQDNRSTPLYKDGPTIASASKDVDPALLKGAMMRELAGAKAPIKDMAALTEMLMASSGALPTNQMTSEQSINVADALVKLGNANEGIDGTGKVVGRGSGYSLPSVNAKEFDSSAWIYGDTDASDQVNHAANSLKANAAIKELGLTNEQIMSAAGEAVKNNSELRSDGTYKLKKGFDPIDIVAEATTNAARLRSLGGGGTAKEMPPEARAAYNKAETILSGLVTPKEYAQPNWSGGYDKFALSGKQVEKSRFDAIDKDFAKLNNKVVVPNAVVDVPQLAQNSLVNSYNETGKLQPEEVKKFAAELIEKSVDPDTVKYAVERATKNNNIAELLVLNPDYKIKQNENWVDKDSDSFSRFALGDALEAEQIKATIKAQNKGATYEQAVEEANKNPKIIELTNKLSEAKKLAEEADFIRKLQTLPTHNVQNLLRQRLSSGVQPETDSYKSIMSWAINKE